MKRLMVIAFVIAISASLVSGAVRVRGYTRSNGTYVQSYYRSNPDSSIYNNWNYSGNINPYTGSIGTRSYSGYSGYSGYSLNSGYSGYSWRSPSYSYSRSLSYGSD